MSNDANSGKKVLNVPNLGFTDAIWKRYRISDLCNVIGGGTPSTSEPSFWDGELQWFTPTEIGKTKYVQNSARTITQKGYKASSAKMLPVGTVLLTTRATIGDASIALKECCTNQGFQSLVAKNDNDNEFLYYLIQTKRKELKTKANGSTFIEISNQEVRNINVLVPDSKTQTKIAGFLSLLDKRIETQNKIIEELKTSIKAILDDFFTNKSNSKVGNYITEISLRNKNNLGYPVFSVSNKKGFIPQNEQFEDKVIASDDKSSYKIVSKNTFAYNPARINVGSIGLYEHDSPCIVSPMYNCFNVLEIEPTYLLMYFKSSFFINEMNKRLEGSVRMCLTMDGLKNLPIYIPSTDEMHKVISVYLSINRKLQNSMKLLDLYLNQKEYLLSNLFI